MSTHLSSASQIRSRGPRLDGPVRERFTLDGVVREGVVREGVVRDGVVREMLAS